MKVLALVPVLLIAILTSCQIPAQAPDSGPPAPIVDVESGIVQTVLTDEQRLCAAATVADEFFVPPGTPFQAVAQTIERVCGILPTLEQDIFGLINVFSAKREMLRRAHVALAPLDAGPLEAGSFVDAAPPPKKK
jgi:hypothetical protein